MNDFLSGNLNTLTNDLVNTMLGFVRAGRDGQRLQALNLVFAQVQAPLTASSVAVGANAGAYADFLQSLLLSRLYVDPADQRGNITVNPPSTDADVQNALITLTNNDMMNSDGYRSFDEMRPTVDVLKAMQSLAALQVLENARTYWQGQRASQPANVQLAIDDLIARINVATTPYFQ